MNIYIASDHGGFELKEHLVKYLNSKGYALKDLGNKEFDPQDDYPDFIIPLAKEVVKDSDGVGIILGRSGNGEMIIANKVKGIRAALCMNEEMAKHARLDNHANVLSLGADYINEETAEKVVEIFINTKYGREERYKRRVNKIRDYEAS